MFSINRDTIILVIDAMMGVVDLAEFRVLVESSKLNVLGLLDGLAGKRVVVKLVSNGWNAKCISASRSATLGLAESV